MDELIQQLSPVGIVILKSISAAIIVACVVWGLYQARTGHLDSKDRHPGP